MGGREMEVEMNYEKTSKALDYLQQAEAELLGVDCYKSEFDYSTEIGHVLDLIQLAREWLEPVDEEFHTEQV